MATSQIRRLQKRVAVFAGVAVVLAVWLVLRPDPSSGTTDQSLPLLLPNFDGEAVRKIVIARVDPEDPEAGEQLTLLRRGAKDWVLSDRFDHPVLSASIERLFEELGGARDRGLATDRADTFDRYRPSTGWKTLRLEDGSGKLIASVDMGRVERGDLFTRVDQGGTTRVHRVSGLRPALAPTEAVSWIDTQMWPGNLEAKTMVRLDLDRRAQPGGELVRLVKRGLPESRIQLVVPPTDPEDEKKVWYLLAPDPPGDADTFEVEDLARGFAGLLIADVVGRSTTPDQEAAFGFDKPTTIATFYADVGEQVVPHTLTIGAKHAEKDAWYARVEGRGFQYLVSSGHALDRLRNLGGSDLRASTEGSGGG